MLDVVIFSAKPKNVFLLLIVFKYFLKSDYGHVVWTSFLNPYS